MIEHERDWDAQQERLSAYLDGRLEGEERAMLDAHLTTCARCAAELTELRQVVRLLHALPAPALPRSFTLPEPVTRQTLPSGVRDNRTSGGRMRRWSAAIQWAGGIAAVFGVVLLLSSALVGAHLGQESMAGSTAPYAPSHAQLGSSDTATPGSSSGTTAGNGASASGSPTAGSTLSPESPQRAPAHNPEANGGSRNTNASGISVNGTTVGLALVICGMLAFIIGRLAAWSPWPVH